MDIQEGANTWCLPKTICASVFRAYDIRGVVGKDIDEHVVYAIGRAFATEAQIKQQRAVVVGYDGRLSSDLFQQALCQGLLEGGVDVINVGRVPTPMVYFATHYLPTQSGVMITGSHNPRQYNGMKLVLAGNTLKTSEIQGLHQRIMRQDFSKGKGHYRKQDLLDAYIDAVVKRITLKRVFKLVIDYGHGMGALTAGRLYRKLGCDVVELFSEIDGRFPHHHPDPTVADNLQSLIHAVHEHRADLGLAFDGDADRIGVVTNQGEIIWPDRLMMLCAKDVLEHQPKAPIVFDVKCSSHLSQVIQDHGGKSVMWKTGHSLLKAKMLELNAPLAGELSGHIFYRQRWYGFDDGVYVGARLLEILSHQSQTVSEVFAALPDRLSTPEMKIVVDEEQKFVLIDQLIRTARFDDAHVTTIDGLRVDFKNAWFVIRASNTTACLTVRFEADSPACLKYAKNQLRRLLLALDETLNIPF